MRTPRYILMVAPLAALFAGSALAQQPTPDKPKVVDSSKPETARDPPVKGPETARDDQTNTPETARDAGGPETARDDQKNVPETARDSQANTPPNASSDRTHTPENATDDPPARDKRRAADAAKGVLR
jgi:hypothetical protein